MDTPQEEPWRGARIIGYSARYGPLYRRRQEKPAPGRATAYSAKYGDLNANNVRQPSKKKLKQQQ